MTTASSTSAGETTTTTEATDATSTDESTQDATSSGSTTLSKGDLGCGGACEPDAPAEAACDVWAQDCPEGQKCVAWSRSGGARDDTKCAPVTGDGQAGDPCVTPNGPTAGEDTCSIGHVCLDVDPDTLEGVCAALCAGTAQQPSCAAVCSGCSVIGAGLFGVCLPTCDPIAQDCLGASACVIAPAGDGFNCVSQAPSGHPAGSPCAYVDDCDPGLVCIDPSRYPAPDCARAEGCCAPLCDLDASQCPGEPANLLCFPWFQQGVGSCHENVGVCRIE
ncbi:MAG: hypothetical protein KC636_01700 [Myxococcales bacterium]|nr:hypothetical protein [Myxococcales bacterium]